jgi:hypothetical protein
MGTFGFDKLSFIVGLGITLLLCGLIMFYVKQKFSVYDRSITEQSQLLKYLVSSIQMGPQCPVSAPGAVDEAKRAHNSFGIVGGNSDGRILVSDDEDDDNESEDESDIDSDESDSESDSVSDNENDDDNYSHKSKLFNLNSSVLDDDKLNIKQINLSSDNIKIVNVDDVRLASEHINHLTSELLSEDNHNHRENNQSHDDDKTLQELNLDDNDELIGDSTSKLDNLENMLEKRKYVELSKTQLQDLCKERNLSQKGSKKDLIDRLME